MVTIKILEGEVKGRWWGPKNVRPILCFHGWLDNCGVFDKLIPLLPTEYSYLALDLPGHGRSYRRPIGMGYNSMDFIVFLERIRKYFNWDKLSIMGHSYSAMSTFYYAAVFPQHMDLYIGLDNMEPYNYNTLINMRKAVGIYLRVVDGNEKTLNDEPPSYTYDQLLDKIVVGSTDSVPRSLADCLILRSVLPSKKHPGKYYFAFDPTWKACSRDPRHEEDVKIMAKQINCPVLYILGQDSYVRDRNINHTMRVLEYWETKNSELNVHFGPGNHHFLLSHPESTANFVVPFLRKYRPEIRNKL